MPLEPNELDLANELIHLEALNGTIWREYERLLHFFYKIKGIHYGICFPSTCSAQDISRLASNIIEPVLNHTARVSVGPEEDCSTQNEVIPYTWKQKFLLNIIQLVIVTVALATLMDYLVLKGADPDTVSYPFAPYIAHLSAIRSTRNLLTLTVSPHTESNISCTHGLKAIAMLIVVLHHILLFSMTYTRQLLALHEMENFVALFSDPTCLALYLGFLTMESLFPISGLLLGFLETPSIAAKKGRLNYFELILKRWLRYFY